MYVTNCCTCMDIMHPSMSVLAWPACTVTQPNMTTGTAFSCPDSSSSQCWSSTSVSMTLFAERHHVFHPLFLGTNRHLSGALAFLRWVFQQPFVSPYIGVSSVQVLAALLFTLSLPQQTILLFYSILSECSSSEPFLNQLLPVLSWTCSPPLWRTRSQSDD